MRLASCFLIAALVLVPCLCWADISPWMSYQGVLRDGAGNPVPDGTYSVTFRIYDVSAGGSALWTEAHSLTAADGIVNANLGASVPLTSLAFDVPYWLGVSVEGEAELVPRTALTSVPYAAHAGYADTCLEGDDDWEFNGDHIYRSFGNVGIGRGTPTARLDVLAGDGPAGWFENASTVGDAFTLRAVNDHGSAGAFFGGTVPSSYPGTPAAVYAVGGSGVRGGHFSSQSNEGIMATSTSGKALWAESSTNHAGFFIGGLGVYVQNTLETGGFKMPTGASPGHVLTSDASGVGTWQPAGSGGDSDWTIAGSDMYSGVSGRVGIGTASPTAKLEINHGTSSEEALEVKHSASIVNPVVSVERTATALQNQDVLQLKIPSGSDWASQFIECERGSVVEFAVDGDGFVNSNEGASFGGSVGIAGALTVSGSASQQGYFSSNLTGTGTNVLSGVCSGSGAGGDPIGVYGEAVPADYYGVGGSFLGGWRGVLGTVYPNGVGNYAGVYGYVAGAAGSHIGVNYGVYGYATAGNINYGVFGYASDGVTNYAGYFAGNLHATGTLTAGTKSFKIDHPLDPENKYLVHSCVESDGMMNIYNGNAELDTGGEAWVQMPDWFEALNEDFRYQLTCIGGFAPVYVAEEIRDGRFLIAGGVPGMKVSWQVTGVRHDPLAVASRSAVEVDKRADEVGKYMHPQVYGRPESEGVGYAEQREYTVTRSAGPVELPTRERTSDDR